MPAGRHVGDDGADQRALADAGAAGELRVKAMTSA